MSTTAKQKNNGRRGFTITELAIVMAVIAVLAAVMIPTFAGVLSRSDQSADAQTVHAMNIVLQMESILNDQIDFETAKAVLAENGYTSFRPHADETAFYWIPGENVIVICEAQSGAVLYPEHYVGQTRADTWQPLLEET